MYVFCRLAIYKSSLRYVCEQNQFHTIKHYVFTILKTLVVHIGIYALLFWSVKSGSLSFALNFVAVAVFISVFISLRHRSIEYESDIVTQHAEDVACLYYVAKCLSYCYKV